MHSFTRWLAYLPNLHSTSQLQWLMLTINLDILLNCVMSLEYPAVTHFTWYKHKNTLWVGSCAQLGMPKPTKNQWAYLTLYIFLQVATNCILTKRGLWGGETVFHDFHSSRIFSHGPPTSQRQTAANTSVCPVSNNVSQSSIEALEYRNT